MGSYYWIKVYHEVLHDPKMGRLSDHLWRRFFEMCLMAGELDQEGYLPSIGDMAWTLRTTADDLETDLLLLQENDLLTMDTDGSWFVTKFSDRQAPLSAAERKARQRERDRLRDYDNHGPVTQGVTIRDTEQDTDTDQNQIRADTESDAPAVVVALESVGMCQIDTVLTETDLGAQQIIDTCAWAVENEKDAALVRALLRHNEAHRPRAPANDRRRHIEGKYADIIES